MSLVNITLDGRPIQVTSGTTVFQAAKAAGIPIPHLCYHPALAPEGSCRMCVVEIEGLPKLELACSTVVREGMNVHTSSERVAEARRGVLEFLLAEHPLDCPICDKAGECKLQDYYEEYGLFESRYQEPKDRKEKRLPIGKTLILDRERCILCSRCVRFLQEVTRTCELGIFERGSRSEVGIYEGVPVDNNYSGCLAEICPVGAITDSDFRFKTRSWFLQSGETICPRCSRGCSIILEYHPGFPRVPGTRKVYRIRARENPEVNGHLICDFGRYGYRFLDEDRCELTAVRSGEIPAGRRLTDEILRLIARKLRTINFMRKPSRVALVLNSWLTNEELFLLRKIFKQDLGVEKIVFADPPDGAGDGTLLTEERSPNRRGAREMEFDLRGFEPAALAVDTEILLLFGPFLADRFSVSDLKAAFEKVETKVLFTSHLNGLETLADIVIPTASFAEKAGSYINVDGRLQRFAPVMDLRGQGQPEWKLLVELGKDINIDFRFFQGLKSEKDIFTLTRRAISQDG